MNYNKFPWTNFHGFNLDWVIEKVQECISRVTTVEDTVSGFPDIYETQENITTNRKLSESGDFTGTLNGETIASVNNRIDENESTIDYVEDRINSGSLIDGIVDNGSWDDPDPETEEYDGGVW